LQETAEELFPEDWKDRLTPEHENPGIPMRTPAAAIAEKTNMSRPPRSGGVMSRAVSKSSASPVIFLFPLSLGFFSRRQILTSEKN
jgi:hypothetical protein